MKDGGYLNEFVWYKLAQINYYRLGSYSFDTRTKIRQLFEILICWNITLEKVSRDWLYFNNQIGRTKIKSIRKLLSSKQTSQQDDLAKAMYISKYNTSTFLDKGRLVFADELPDCKTFSQHFQEKHIQQLKKSIRDKENPLKVAQTRLESRTHRPDVELCRDPPYHRLVDEVGQIQESLDLLNRKLNDAEGSHQVKLLMH